MVPIADTLLQFDDSNDAIHLLRLGLQSLPDSRLAGQVLHPVGDVLFTALCSLIADCEDYIEMALFAQTQLDWLRHYVPLVNGAPSHDTFRNVFMMVKPQALLDITTAWVGCLEGRHIRVDGKVNRGVKDPETGRSRLHLLRAWVGEVGLSVGQAVCDDKSNEAATLPQLLDSLQLKGALVSIDAMAGHAEVAQQIQQAGGHWLLALKGNEKETFEIICAHFRTLCGQQAPMPEGYLPDHVPVPKTLHPPQTAPQQWPQDITRILSQERTRGRYEQREVIVVPVGDWWPKAYLWYGVASVVCVIRTTMRQRHDKEFPLQEVHYYLTSLPPEQAEQIAKAIREHWAIENGCHHLLDVTYHEDHCQVRDLTAAHNLTLMREISAKLIKDHPLKGSVRNKRKRAALSAVFRAEVVAPIFHTPHA
jgi:predicted transposase YbfD/YdcC